MRLYPETHLTTDWLYDRSHRIWTELVMLIVAYPLGFAGGLLS